MPLDHYISQVYLKNFHSPILGDRLYAIRKSDLKLFAPNAKAVCAINDGNTNPYLRDDRAIEQFLKTIEPRYNDALRKLIAKQIDHESIYTVSGFVAFIITCSPTGVRLSSGLLKNVVEDRAAELDTQGLFSPPPRQLNAANLTELLRRGDIEITIDFKFPQAIGIESILETTASFGNFTWEILQNDFDDSPFFTSDFPVAIENTEDTATINRIFPLAPNLAVRIRPNRALSKESRTDPSFRNFRSLFRKVSRKELTSLNRLIVRCAEDMVFYRNDQPWVQKFIAKNRSYRIEGLIHEQSTLDGTRFVPIQKVAATAPD